MRKHAKAIAAIMLTMCVMMMSGCKPDDDPSNGGNGGGSNHNQDELPAGMYLGVIGFNDALHTKAITRLDASAVSSVTRFIDGLRLGGATLLYHAVDTSINLLESYGIPKDLLNVSIVTFTDGLDKGSYAFSEFNSGAEYLRDVTKRLRNEKIAGVNIEAHTVGFQGNDVYSYDMDEFLANLNGLSSLPANEFVHPVDNFEDIQAVFDTIAERLHKRTQNSKLAIKMPVEDPNTRVRFTFDITTTGTDDASQSQKYIEGVYITNSERNGVLTNVRYQGLGSSSGNAVTSNNEGAFANFVFEGMTDSDNKPLNSNSVVNLREWIYNNNVNAWVHNSEFISSGNTEMNHEYYSSMIMLNLDCSQSLGESQFNTLKEFAKRFVSGLNVNP